MPTTTDHAAAAALHNAASAAYGAWEATGCESDELLTIAHDLAERAMAASNDEAPTATIERCLSEGEEERGHRLWAGWHRRQA